MDDGAALKGILFVLHTGIPSEDLPKELGFGSGDLVDSPQISAKLN